MTVQYWAELDIECVFIGEKEKLEAAKKVIEDHCNQYEDLKSELKIDWHDDYFIAKINPDEASISQIENAPWFRGIADECGVNCIGKQRDTDIDTFETDVFYYDDLTDEQRNKYASVIESYLPPVPSMCVMGYAYAPGVTIDDTFHNDYGWVYKSARKNIIGLKFSFKIYEHENFDDKLKFVINDMNLPILKMNYYFAPDEALDNFGNDVLTLPEFESMSDEDLNYYNEIVEWTEDMFDNRHSEPGFPMCLDDLSPNEVFSEISKEKIANKISEYMALPSPITGDDEQLLYITLKKVSESSMDDYMTFCQLLNDKEAMIYRYNNELFIYLANAKEHITTEQLSSFNFIRRCLVNNEKVYAKWNKRAERNGDIEELRYSFLYNLIKQTVE